MKAIVLEILSIMAWLPFTSENLKASLLLVEQVGSDWFLLTSLGCLLITVVNPFIILTGDTKARLHVQRLLRVLLCRKVVVKPKDSLDCFTAELSAEVAYLSSKRFQPTRFALSVVEQSKFMQQTNAVRSGSTPEACLLHKVSIIPETISTQSVATK